MGTDDLYHRRKARKAVDLARKKASREPYPKVLIVCEGEKTEPNYFSELKDHLELSSTNVVVTGECGSNPISVTDYAIQLFRREGNTGDPFDRVYCVFDKDTHATYQQALDEIADADPEDIFIATTSVPCFEYWLLLHFEYTTAPFRGTGGKSSCNRLIDKLKKYMPGYQKGDESIFEQLLDSQPQATAYAVNSLRAAEKSENDNPSTKIHELIEYLQNIKTSIADK